jgi:hypothetical protein
MSSVKFECPACSQHMECERACSGDVIHCPGCGAQIRVPFHNVAEIDGAFSRAELVAPATPDAAAPNVEAPIAHHEGEKREATVNCPACHAELKVVIPANSHAASTTLLHGPPPVAHEPGPASTETEQHPDFAHMSLEERERQIARAREAHPIQVNTNAKPRLEYVLEGKPPPSTGHQ